MCKDWEYKKKQKDSPYLWVFLKLEVQNGAIQSEYEASGAGVHPVGEVVQGMSLLGEESFCVTVEKDPWS